jgi:Zn finger protein HypA/HybF involved in hydrogenase expression
MKPAVVELVDLLKQQHQFKQGRHILLSLGKVDGMEMDSLRRLLEIRHLAVVAEEVIVRDSRVDLAVEDLTTKPPAGPAQQAKDLQEDSQLRQVEARVVEVLVKPVTQMDQDLVVTVERRPSPEQASPMPVEVLHLTL